MKWDNILAFVNILLKMGPVSTVENCEDSSFGKLVQNCRLPTHD